LILVPRFNFPDPLAVPVACSVFIDLLAVPVVCSVWILIGRDSGIGRGRWVLSHVIDES
jgi:hypothetical protein